MKQGPGTGAFGIAALSALPLFGCGNHAVMLCDCPIYSGTSPSKAGDGVTLCCE